MFSSGFRTGMALRSDWDERRKKERIAADMAALEEEQPAPAAAPGQAGPAGQPAAGGFALPGTQAMTARAMAQAGVLRKHGDIEGASRLERDAVTLAQQGARFEREQKTWADADAAKAKADEEEKARREAFGKTRFARSKTAFETAQQQYEREMADYQARRAAGDTGAKLGVEPVPPTRPSYTLGDYVADAADLLEFEGSRGKVTPQGFAQFQQVMETVKSEGYQAALQAAQSGAPIEKVAELFNSAGRSKIDPAAVLSDKVVKGANGVPTRVIQYRDPAGQVQTLNTVAELDALGKADKVYSRFYQQQEAERASAAAASTAAERAKAAAREKEREAAAVGVFKEQNPGATPAQIEAVRTGVMPALPGSGNASDPAEVKLARAALAARVPGVTDMAGALQWARGKSETSPQELHQQIVVAKVKEIGGSAKDAIAAADEVLTAMGYQKGSGGRWTQPAAAAPAASGGQPAAGALPPLDKRVVGQTYNTPRGPAVWRGTGWELVKQ